jgi:quinoprotein glucose dehydrogenase
MALIVGAMLPFDATTIKAQRASQDGGPQPTGSGHGEWRAYGGDAHGTKYSALSQITADNVQDLRIAWRAPALDRAIQASNPLWRTSRNADTPLMVNGVLYTVTGLGVMAALDPATGQTRWVYDPESYKGSNARPAGVGFTVRGLAYWTDGKAERLLHATSDAYVTSVDAKTGKPDAAFGTGGKVDLTSGIRDAKRVVNFVGRTPTVAGDILVAGNLVDSQAPNKEMPPGDVKAFNVRTGKLLWTFHMVPRPGEAGYETWLEDAAEYSGNANVWAGIAYDPELDYVYLPGSSASNDYYGGLRLGDNLFADSLVCLEAKTGKRVWHFQTGHHGVWDYDLPTNPIVGDITVAGRRIKAVLQVSKQGFTYVFDRRTGAPVWPIEERPVPQSTVPRERTSPTQQFPTKPPAFELQGTTESSLIDFTPELKKQALDLLRTFEYGPLYTPPSLTGTVMLPGVFGGANWGGAGFDPETGMLYVPSIMSPSLIRLAPGDPARTNHLYRSGGPGPSVEKAVIDGLPIFKPPYARVTAIEMNQGAHAWMQPLGNGPRTHPLLRDLNLPPLGDQIYGGSVLVTKTLLFVSVTRLQFNGIPKPAPWAMWGDPDADRKMIYVFDKRNGKLLRVIEMDGLSAAAPMTYLHGGRQYIVVAAGGGQTSELVAFSISGTSGK